MGTILTGAIQVFHVDVWKCAAVFNFGKNYGLSIALSDLKEVEPTPPASELVFVEGALDGDRLQVFSIENLPNPSEIDWLGYPSSYYQAFLAAIRILGPNARALFWRD